MRNRIGHLVPQTVLSHSELCRRPTLTLNADRPITVDMERFFDFTFSFAEALLDLEAQFQSEPKVTALERLLADTSTAKADECSPPGFGLGE